MNILHVNTTAGFVGGVERYIYSAADLLSGRHAAVGLFEERLGDSQGFTEAFRETWLFHDLDTRRRRELIEAIDVAFVHKISNPDLFQWLVENFTTILIVHDHDYYCVRRHKYYPLVRINCHRPFHPVVCSLCSGLLEKRAGKIAPVSLFRHMRLLESARRTDRQVVLSDFMRDNLIKNGFDAERIEKIHPFYHIQSANVRKETSGPAQLLYVGQIIRGKGVDQLIESLQYLKNSFSLSIIGQGNDREYIQSLIRQYNLEKRVVLEGWKSNVDKYYHAADLLIVPSRWQEPFGLIGMEAFSHHVPVVGFDVGGIGEWLRDGENGYLVEPGNPAEMARKIDHLIDNPELRHTMGEAGYQLVKNEYNRENFLERFHRLLSELNNYE